MYDMYLAGKKSEVADWEMSKEQMEKKRSINIATAEDCLLIRKKHF